MMKIKELTRAEEQLMQILWQLKKGFVGHTAYGKSHEYHPVISKEQYQSFATEKLMTGYFNNSVKSMFSYFVNKEKIDLKEADEIMRLIEDLKNK